MFFEQDRASSLFEQALDNDEQRSISAALDDKRAISVACLVVDDGNYVRMSLTAQPVGTGSFSPASDGPSTDAYSVTTNVSYDVPATSEQADNVPLVDVLVGEGV